MVTGQGWQQAALIGAGAGASWLRGAGSPCQVGQSLSRFGQIAKTLGTTGQRGLALFGMGSGVASGVQRIAAGDTIGGVLDILGAGASAYRFMQSCFTGDRLVETDRGPRRIDSIQKGDRLLARSEGDLHGPLEYKEVLQTFVRVAPVLNLHVAGKLIPTTKEHPFWLKDIGWMPAGELMPGDLIAGKLEGEWLRVEGVAESGQVLTVYNLKVSEYHTYFVGGEDWGFSVWVHNADYPTTAKGRQLPEYSEKEGAVGWLSRPGGGETFLRSGNDGPSSGARYVRKMNGRIKSHVEAHAVVVMKAEGLQESTLYINRVPCQRSSNPKDFTFGCHEALPHMLSPGQRLRVVGPDGFDHTYVGLAANDPARQVAKPSRLRPEIIPQPNWKIE